MTSLQLPMKVKEGWLILSILLIVQNNFSTSSSLYQKNFNFTRHKLPKTELDEKYNHVEICKDIDLITLRNILR